MSAGYNRYEWGAILENNAVILKILAFLVLTLFGASKALKKAPTKKSGLYTEDVHVFGKVNPVSKEFRWNETPPLKSYPFKDKPYKLTMGISSLDVQEWLLIEPTYKQRTEYKEKLIKNIHEDYGDQDTRSGGIHSCKESDFAIKEFYDIVVKYMCDKYPVYFKKQEEVVVNLIKGIEIPARSVPSVDPATYLEYLCQTIEEDIIIMMKDPEDATESEYRFTGGIFAFAAGFDPADLFGKPLSGIHEPVPRYREKLRVSMNRFFDRIKVGQFVTRSNFSFQTHDRLYTQGNKGRDPLDVVYNSIPAERLDFERDVFYRSERQTLTRLPKSKAVIFTIRTYLLPVSEVKKEGPELCKRLAGAIKGLPEDMAHYKRASEWGPATIQYLLDEKN